MWNCILSVEWAVTRVRRTLLRGMFSRTCPLYRGRENLSSPPRLRLTLWSRATVRVVMEYLSGLSS